MITKVTHLTFFVHNQDEALQFYTQKLGFKLHTDAQFGPMRWLTVHPAGQPDFEIALILAETPEEKALVGKQAASKPLISLETTDCAADYEALKANGVVFVDEPTTQPWGVSVMCKDLYGNMIYMCQPA